MSGNKTNKGESSEHQETQRRQTPTDRLDPANAGHNKIATATRKSACGLGNGAEYGRRRR